ncbi:unnamed protein product [Leptosia nina]|uniref:Putative alpha-L-fucosidase n=1 Tax=Leptosia nina TaxID=320188 RepID=A0AAV1JTJ7_9NEOP
MEWSREKTLKLVGLLQVNATLWNPTNCETRRAKQRRKQELRSIANVFRISVFDITKKIQHLRTQYNRELARESIARAQNPNENYVVNWYAYDYLHFLKDSNKPFRLVNSDGYYGNGTPNDDETPRGESKNTSPLPPKIARSDNIEGNIEYSSPKKRDEFTVYGEYIANELRSLKCERSLLLAKKRIQDVIFEVKMNMLTDYSQKSNNVFTTSITQAEPMRNDKMVYTVPVINNNEALPTSEAQPTSTLNEIIINEPKAVRMAALTLWISCLGLACGISKASISESNNKLNVIEHFESRPTRYSPSWKDLDTRPLPEWYDRAKIGIFLHWGVFSVPSFGSEWFWSNWVGGNQKYIDFMNQNYPPGFTYQEFAPMFKAEFFDPNAWADLFKKAGAKYIVLTSKHHEGYTLFPSKRSFSWNSVDVGPKRDLVGDVAEAVRKQGMKFGVYHSLYEWYNPIYLEDKKSLFLSKNYPTTKLWPDIKQLINDYQPSVLWSDGDWEALDAYWNSTDLLAWLYNDSPVKDEIVVNDRWGIGIPCHHGDFYNCADRYNPGTLQAHKWENAFTVDSKSWGYRRNMNLSEILTIEQLLKEVVSTVSCGGNALINVGPTKEGTIAPIFQERLLALGEWLQINGEAIYETSPWKHQNDSLNSDAWYTCTKSEYDGVKDIATYLHRGTLQVTLLGSDGTLNWKINSGVAYIQLPSKNTVKSNVGWSLKFSYT